MSICLGVPPALVSLLTATSPELDLPYVSPSQAIPLHTADGRGTNGTANGAHPPRCGYGGDLTTSCQGSLRGQDKGAPGPGGAQEGGAEEAAGAAGAAKTERARAGAGAEEAGGAEQEKADGDDGRGGEQQE